MRMTAACPLMHVLWTCCVLVLRAVAHTQRAHAFIACCMSLGEEPPRSPPIPTAAERAASWRRDRSLRRLAERASRRWRSESFRLLGTGHPPRPLPITHNRSGPVPKADCRRRNPRLAAIPVQVGENRRPTSGSCVQVGRCLCPSREPRCDFTQVLLESRRAPGHDQPSMAPSVPHALFSAVAFRLVAPSRRSGLSDFI
jgi:hypothetical protein